MKKYIILFLVLSACVGCDQISKHTARHYLSDRPALSFMGDTFRLDYTENRGAFLGLGAGLPEHVRTLVFVVLVSLFLIGFVLYILFDKTLETLALSSSALIIGGGVGNLIDRILNQGAVVDFMNMGIGPIRTGVFNVADVAIVGGLLLFVLSNIKKRPERPDNGES